MFKLLPFLVEMCFLENKKGKFLS